MRAYRYKGWRKRDLAGLGLALAVGTVVGGAFAFKCAFDAYLDDKGLPW